MSDYFLRVCDYLLREDESASDMSRTEAAHATRSTASSAQIDTQFRHQRRTPYTAHKPRRSTSVFTELIHVFSWPPARHRHPLHGGGDSEHLINVSSDRRRTCPNHRSRCCCTTVEILGIPKHFRRISSFDTLSFQPVFEIRRKHQWSKASSFLISSTRVGQVSHPYNKTGRIAARNTRIFVRRLISPLSHRFLLSWRKANLALSTRNLISSFAWPFGSIVEPRYRKEVTCSNSSPAIDRRVLGLQDVVKYFVLFALICSPIVLAYRLILSSMGCRSSGSLPNTTMSSAYSRSAIQKS